MATRSDQDVDDDFSEIYKEYTGPQMTVNSSAAKGGANSSGGNNGNKRSLGGFSDEEEEAPDPNAVPTDFTSREAKVWEAKSKATERNWKKRKEEEMICKICGDSGHFTQGCPTTLGANRKSQDFFERVPAKDKHVRAVFTEKVMERIEKDIGCKLKMDEKFIIVSGKDRLILSKGVDAVHKVIKGEGDQKCSSSSQRSRSRSADRSPVGFQRSESQRSHSGHPRDTSSYACDTLQYQQRFGRPDRTGGDRVREDRQKFSRGTPQGREQHRIYYDINRKLQELPTIPAPRTKCLTCSSFHEAYGNEGARSRSGHSKSPGRPPYTGNPYRSYDGHGMGGYKADRWNAERQGSDLQSGHQFEYSTYPQNLEELEMEHKREAMELARIRDKEEDEENYKHRETIRAMRENYMEKLSILRGTHARQWDEFLHLDAQRRQQHARQQMSASGFGSYKQQGYSDYDGSGNPQYAGASLPVDSRTRYPNHVESFPSRSHDTYGEFHRQRRDDFGKAYNNRY